MPRHPASTVPQNIVAPPEEDENNNDANANDNDNDNDNEYNNNEISDDNDTTKLCETTQESQTTTTALAIAHNVSDTANEAPCTTLVVSERQLHQQVRLHFLHRSLSSHSGLSSTRLNWAIVYSRFPPNLVI